MVRFTLSKSFILRITLGFFLFSLVAASPMLAQTSGSEQISWEDDDEEEEGTEEAVPTNDWDREGPGKHEDVAIRLNGKPFDLKDDLKVKREDTLEISVRHLAPGSFVSVQMEKGGIKLSRKGYYANSLGQLDLEVRTGGKKVSGKAILYYTPSNGKKRERQVTVTID